MFTKVNEANMSKTISARIDDTMHTMITDEANHEGVTVNEKLKGMLNGHFNEEGKKEISLSHNEGLEQEILENQNNQKNEIKGMNEILKKIVDSLKVIQRSTLQAVDQRFDDHMHNYKHDMKCADNGLRCNSS